MWLDRVLNTGPLVHESGALPTVPRSPAALLVLSYLRICRLGKYSSDWM